ncbi:hypothetical protein PV08_09380 [Exophiala spinifera]|uniref:Uncharacterized protein n=1 Tax=Exophiala spinifera TaxID=91928 RepID=A0A0D1YB25_9EURO|nr:uncharacterized protein PV08_09380 [Exophiala spinifera]KIW12106.1 hypothetical protein PV08_09380 [Exophiala spinifera]
MRSEAEYHELANSGQETLQTPSDVTYEKGSGTRQACLIGLGFSILVGITFFVLGCVVPHKFNGEDDAIAFSPVVLELLTLGIDFAVLIITEINGYIHSLSLRWALSREGRLDFNSSLRLLTVSQKTPANGLLANIAYFITLSFSYGASSVIVVRNTYVIQAEDLGSSAEEWKKHSHDANFSRVGPLSLGIAILVQCALSIWCLQSQTFASWDSSPLTTLAATRSRSDSLLTQPEISESRSSPTNGRRSPYASRPRIRLVLVLVTIVFLAFVVWTALLIPYGIRNQPNGNWAFFPTSTNGNEVDDPNTMTIFLKFFKVHNEVYENRHGGLGPDYVSEANLFGILLLYVVLQSFITIGLHSAELQILMLRDESLWQKSASGYMSRSFSSVTAPLQSPPNAALLLFKPILHWLFAVSLSVDYAQGMAMRAPQTAYLTAAWAVFVLFTYGLSFYRPNGALPQTYGRLDTMRDKELERLDSGPT